jgi:hypothetical protein
VGNLRTRLLNYLSTSDATDQITCGGHAGQRQPALLDVEKICPFNRTGGSISYTPSLNGTPIAFQNRV